MQLFSRCFAADPAAAGACPTQPPNDRRRITSLVGRLKETLSVAKQLQLPVKQQDSPDPNTARDSFRRRLGSLNEKLGFFQKKWHRTPPCSMRRKSTLTTPVLLLWNA